MQPQFRSVERRTAADEVFDFLNAEIGNLRLLPGTKISEADIAAKFGISRQPVRDAFNRLSNLDLVQIRPQRATIVKRFSMEAINAARFVRMSVELEVLRQAVRLWDTSWQSELETCIKNQETVIAKGDLAAFNTQDYKFHELLSQIAKTPFAFDVIQANKAKVDRLCLLGLSNNKGKAELISDHITMVQQLTDGDEKGLCQTLRLHLGRLDETIDLIYKKHQAFFE